MVLPLKLKLPLSPRLLAAQGEAAGHAGGIDGLVQGGRNGAILVNHSAIIRGGVAEDFEGCQKKSEPGFVGLKDSLSW